MYMESAKNDLINKVCKLHIETINGIIVDTKFDACHLDAIKNLSWSPLNTRNDYYLHG